MHRQPSNTEPYQRLEFWNGELVVLRIDLLCHNYRPSWVNRCCPGLGRTVDNLEWHMEWADTRQFFLRQREEVRGDHTVITVDGTRDVKVIVIEGQADVDDCDWDSDWVAHV